MARGHWSRTLVTAPAYEPVTTSEAKAHMHVTHSEDDDLIASYIAAARSILERQYGRLFCNQVHELVLDRFPHEIFLPMAPVQEIEFIKYLDATGTEQTLDESGYQVDLRHEPGRVRAAFGLTWPTTRNVYNAVTIRFRGGYAEADGSPTDQVLAAANVPANLKLAVKHLVSHFYENREPVVVGQTVTELPFSVSALMAPFEVFAGPVARF